MEEREFIEVWAWVLEVGDKILDVYHSNFEIRDKGGNDPVTEADLLASEFLQTKITNAFPSHGFLSEERKDTRERLDKEFVWILDPIDGTREFVKKNDQFALSLGLVRNGRAIWGIIFNPATGEFFSKGKMSFFTKLKPPFATKANLEQVLLASKTIEHPFSPNPPILTKPKLLISFSEMKEGIFDESVWKDEFQLQPMGSIAYKLGLLSAGFIDLIVSLKPKNEWDICGGISLLDEELYAFFPLNGNEYSFNNESTVSYGLVAGSKNAIEYLKSKVNLHILSLSVRQTW